jgi:glyoxylase-like metal-dependent hydrolase (beta-lactamase superfamily II)
MIARWDIITIGNLSRNRYWGESEDRPVRPTLCTSTLIRGDGLCLLVDPSCQEAERMAAELDRRTGLRLSDINAVFLTHHHGDHHFGLAHFPDAQWLAAAGVAAIINQSGEYQKAVEPARHRLLEEIEVIPTPGHTRDHHSLRFDCDGLSVVIAGDAVMTQDFWRDRRGFFNSVDLELASRTMNQIAGVADIVVPGHDNCFLTLRS